MSTTSGHDDTHAAKVDAIFAGVTPPALAKLTTLAEAFLDGLVTVADVDGMSPDGWLSLIASRRTD
jgi:hypothetical protein